MGQIIPHFSYFVSFTCLHITIVMYLSNTSNLLLSKYCIHINIQYRNHGWLLFHCYWKTIRKYICVHRIINTYMYIAVFHIEISNHYSLSEIQNDQCSSTCIVCRRRGVVARCWNSCEKNRCRSRCGGHPSYGPWHAGLSRPLWSFPDYPARGYLVKHPQITLYANVYTRSQSPAICQELNWCSVVGGFIFLQIHSRCNLRWTLKKIHVHSVSIQIMLF